MRLSARRPVSEALAGYEQRRNESATPFFEWACRTAELRAPSGKTHELIAALQSNPEGASRMMGLTAGTVLPRDFFQPDNIARILAGAQ